MLRKPFPGIILFSLLSALSVVTCSDSDMFSRLKQENLKLKIVSVYPSDRSENIPLNTTISVTFNMPVDSATLAGNITVTEAGSEVKGIVTCSDNLVIFDPDTDFSKDAIIKVNIDNGIRSAGNVEMESGFEWSFSTGTYVDKIPPVLTGVIDAVSIRGTGFELRWPAATDNITPKDSIRYYIYVKDTFPDLGTVTPIEVSGRNQYSVTGLTPGKKYYFNVTAMDMAGNNATYPTAGNATTLSRYPFVVTDGEVHATALSGSTLYFGGVFSHAGKPASNALILDAADGNYRSTAISPIINDTVSDVISDERGGWFICGLFTEVNGLTRKYIARINGDGSVNDFNLSVSDMIKQIAISEDGQYLYFMQNNGGSSCIIRKVSTVDGSTVTAWNIPSFGHQVYAMIPIGGYLYVCGAFSTVNSVAGKYLVRLNAETGALDQSWDAQVNGAVMCMSVSDDKKTIYMGGGITSIHGAPRNNAGAVKVSDGSVLPWDPSPDNFVDEIVSSGNYVYMAGQFTNVSGSPRAGICRIDSGILSGWCQNGVNGSVNSITANNGYVYVSGSFTVINGVSRKNIACLVNDVSGSVSGSWVRCVNGIVNSMAINSSGNSFFAGGGYSMLGYIRSNAAAYNISTGELTDWNPNADGMVKAIAIGNNAAYIGGSFTHVGGASNAHLAKTNSTSGAVEKDGGNYWSADGDVNALLIDPSGSSIYIGGLFNNIKGVVSEKIGAYKLNDGSKFTFGSGLTHSNTTSTDSLVWMQYGSTKLVYVGGELTYHTGAFGTENIVQCPENGLGIDQTFYANASKVIYSLCSNNIDSVIVGGGSGTAPGFISWYPVVTVSGSPSWSVNLGTGKKVFSLVYESSKLYASGDFTYTEGSIIRTSLAQFTVSGSSATLNDWGPQMESGKAVYASVIGFNTLFIGGDFTQVDGKSHKGIAAIDMATGKAWE